MQEGPPLCEFPKSEVAQAAALMRAEGPFAGLQVLEIGSGLEVGLAGAILADQGADVVKVEFTSSPEPSRSQGPAPREGMAAQHMAANRGKRSVVVNPGNPRVYEVMERLVKVVDAVLIGIPVEQAAELGLSYYELQQKKKGLVYVSLSGYNSRGPRFWEPGHDALVQALAGGAAACPGRRGEPSLVASSLADKVTAMMAAISLGAACRMQLRGVVQQVELDKFACTVHFNFPDLFHDHVWERLPERPRAAPGLGPHMRLAECGGGKAAYCLAPVSDEEFRGLCEALGHQEWLEIEAWRTLPGRLGDAEALAREVEKAVKALDAASLAAACARRGVPCAPVLGIEECLQAHLGELLESWEHPTLGKFRLPRHAVHFRETPARGRAPAPLLAEGTAECLEACGYDQEEVSALLASGVAEAAPQVPEPIASWLSRWVLGEPRQVEVAAWKQAGFRASVLQSLSGAWPAREHTGTLSAAPTGAVAFAL